MIKKLFIFILWSAGLMILAVGCWTVGLYQNWPLWQSVVLFVVVLVATWIVVLVRRRWLAWRLRRRLAQPVGTGGKVSLKHVDQDWQAGVQALKHSRLSRFGSPLYVLPWFIALGHENDGKSDLLHRAAGDNPVHSENEEPPTMRWWLLPNSVILDPADGLCNDNDVPGSLYWRRMLHWMLHTRRREPLNGMIVTLDAEWLISSDDIELVETGRRLRKRVDELTRIYNMRMPIYVVLTHCEQLPGFRAWGDTLDPEMRTQPMGYLASDMQATASQFIATAFKSITQRMFDLRILKGMGNLPDQTAFGLPERLSLLEERLDKIMRPAFQATPYAETPLLHGLFLTAAPSSAHASESGWFMPELFDRILPGQRHAWQPIERWRHWRRLMSHAAAIAWLVLCVAAAIIMVRGEHVASQQLQAVDWPAPKAFDGALDTDLAALQRARDAILAFQERRSWHTRWLPFQWRINQADEKLRTAFSDHFDKQIIELQIQPLLATSLPLVSQQKDETLLAAWAQFLVLRINLLDGVLNGQNVSRLPVPGVELIEIAKSAGQVLPSLVDTRLVGDLYRHYLEWETDPNVLIESRERLRQTLNGLQLPERSISWIYAWVKLQGYLSPVRMSDYWDIPDTKDQPQIPAALTLAGERAVTAFLGQVGTASGNTELWQQRHAVFEQHYLQASLSDWRTFAVAFPFAADDLPDANARRAVLSSLMNVNGPYRRLVHDMAAVGNRMPSDKRPNWMQQVMRLDSLEQLADAPKETGVTGALQSANILNQLGAKMVKDLPHSGSLPKGFSNLGDDRDSLDDLTAYRNAVQTTIVSLLQGQGSAMQTAQQIWGFGHDPAIKSVPLLLSVTSLKSVHKKLGGSDDSAASDPIWQLIRGPLVFTLDYAARSAACGLQQEWEGSVVNAVQGVDDIGLINQLLYGDRGQITSFLQGPVKSFIDRGAVRYEPREVLGRQIALNGQFYAFANQTQLHQVGILADGRKSGDAKAEIAALTQQNTDLEQQIAKLQASTASVTLSTVPPQVNPDAHILPESVTLNLQCAAKTLTLENLNFPNSAVFPWSMATCSDTVLTIQIGGLTLVKQWSGAQAFVEFLREFSSGQHRYTPQDFPDEVKALNTAGIKYIQLSYRQRGQASLLAAFAKADQLSAQLAQNKERIDSLNPTAGIGLVPAPSMSTVHLPEQIISVCMGPIDTTTPVVEPAPASHVEHARTTSTSPKPAKRSSKKQEHRKRAAPGPDVSGTYSIQVGVFEHAEIVVRRLEENGYKTQQETIPVGNKRYTSIFIRGYKTREDADEVAAEIGKLLNLEPVVLKRRK